MVYKVMPIQCRSCAFSELGACYNDDEPTEDYIELAATGECPGYCGMNEEIDLEGLLYAG